MGQLLSYLRHYKKESILAPLFKMLEALFDLLIPLIMADIINIGIAEGDTLYILRKCGLIVLLGFVGLACSITAQYFSARAAVVSCSDVRRQLFDKAQTLDLPQTDAFGGSTLINRMTSDLNQVQNGLNLFLRLFLRSPFVVFGAVIMAFTVNLRGGLVAAATLPVLALIVFGIMLKSLPMYTRVQKWLDRLTGITRENLTGVRVVRAFGREKEETQRFEAANAELTAEKLGAGGLSALLNPLTYAIVNLALVAILYVGAFEVDNGIIAMGDVVALVNYMGQILVELVKLANLIIQIARAAACAERINVLLGTAPKMQYGEAVPNPGHPEAVVFDHVSLSYNPGSAESLTDISFTALRGETLGVIGGTGSGKSSLVNLIPRYYDATSGTVRVFGKDVREYGKHSLRRCVGTVLQKARLFSGTLRSNLQWGADDASDEALWQALRLAQAEEIARSKGGLDAPVEQGGRNFSGGQKQRLSIARTLAGQPSILILDDASSALDYATDSALRKALSSLPEDVTVFIVSQRANSLRHADHILVLDEGRLVGDAPHRVLLETCPVYREIYESQFDREARA